MLKKCCILVSVGCVYVVGTCVVRHWGLGSEVVHKVKRIQFKERYFYKSTILIEKSF